MVVRRNAGNDPIQRVDTEGSIYTLFGIDAPAWLSEANCAGTDPESFFPAKGGSTSAAKSICAACLVSAECLDWAIELNERFGIYGGLSERERRRLERALRPRSDAS